MKSSKVGFRTVCKGIMVVTVTLFLGALRRPSGGLLATALSAGAAAD
jgi:hypothetical protein